MNGEAAYFRPRQPLGPNENGCDASLISVDVSSSHLDGSNFMGSLKFLGS